MDGNPTAEHTFSENNEGLWVIAAGGNKLVYGGVITGGNSPAGGGVYVAEGGAFTMQGGNIIGCSAREGGGVYVEGSFSMSGGTISGCLARADGDDTRGGGICNFGNTTLFATAKIQGCRAIASDVYGFEDGGLYSVRNLIICDEVTITDCKANEWNGSMQVGCDGNNQISGGIFDDGCTVLRSCRTRCDIQIRIGLNEQLVIAGYSRCSRATILVGKCCHGGSGVCLYGLHRAGAGRSAANLGCTAFRVHLDGSREGLDTCHCIQQICPFCLGERNGTVGSTFCPGSCRERQIFC